MTSREVFEKFVPAEAVSYCNKLYEKLGFEFKVKKARQTKLGDYRFDHRINRHTITVNNDLNQYSFLVTYLHEIAHLVAFKQHGNRIAPHGKEWKNSFKEVVEPILNTHVFPNEVFLALTKYFKNPKASSCSDPTLYLILKKFDGPSELVLLQEIQTGSAFEFNKKQFIKLSEKRTRAVCKEVVTHRKYLISKIAEVIPVNDQKND